MSEANPNYTFLRERVPQQRITLLQGGTRSGKTYAGVDFLIRLCRDYAGSGIEIDIVRLTFKSLKATVWSDLIKRLKEFKIYNADHYNKSDCIYTLFGNPITGYGVDDDAKVHGRSRDILWANEGNQFPKETIDQLFPRTRHRVIIDYNPNLGLDHWLDPYIDQYPPLITTYKDNPHLTAAQIADIESKKDDPFWWKIYGTGERASREGVIFERVSVGEFPEHLPYCYGQDFGWSVDPTTLVRVAVDKTNKKIYVDETWYSKGEQLGTDDLVRKNRAHTLKVNDLIVADDHGQQQRIVRDLQNGGLNIIGSTRTSKSVISGITKMLDYEIVYTSRSLNVRKELSNYIWNDKKAGIPIDEHNHTIDAIRYAFEYLTYGGGFGSY